MKTSFKNNRPKRHYIYNDIFKKANLIIQISSAIFMLLATIGFMFGIVGITLGTVVNTTNIKLNTISGISLLVISSYVFLMCAISLCLSVISNYHKTTIYLEILAIFSIVSIVCMIGGFLIIFSSNKYKDEQEKNTNNQLENQNDNNQKTEDKQQVENQTNIQSKDNFISNPNQQIASDHYHANISRINNNQINNQRLEQAKRNEKYQQVKRTYQLVKEHKLSEDKLQSIFNSDPEFKQMYDELKK
ncbi:tetraspanin family protein [Mycoplasma mycoides]|uniref:YIP1 family protein n=1 Tax=Mycoplasma mycoides TaxID=2102 RepID=UPI00223F6405|nr:YIP1 family protein [Mycoplasma mycoides]QVK02626.1 tetraspanin family protein [Mycoplasma mycoides subsp. capri]QVK03441.1 tetraspanin family protein [Mycoplasma mycoides subsp. capri]